MTIKSRNRVGKRERTSKIKKQKAIPSKWKSFSQPFKEYLNANVSGLSRELLSSVRNQDKESTSLFLRRLHDRIKDTVASERAPLPMVSSYQGIEKKIEMEERVLKRLKERRKQLQEMLSDEIELMQNTPSDDNGSDAATLRQHERVDVKS